VCVYYGQRGSGYGRGDCGPEPERGVRGAHSAPDGPGERPGGRDPAASGRGGGASPDPGRHGEGPAHHRAQGGPGVTTDVEDPFDTPAPPERKILDRGRYWLPRMDGTKKPWGWMRVSNLVSAYSDQFGLRMWEIEHAFRGVAKDSALYADLTDEIARWDRMDKQGRKRAVETFLERCKTVTGGDAGSKHGNQRHHAVEAMHADATLPDQHPDAGTRRSLSLYAAALVRNNLRALSGMQERIVLVESLEVCGRLDNVLEDVAAGGLHIGDLKTQKRFWTWLEVAAQFACYAHADAMWDFERNQWVDMPPVSQDI